MRRLFVFFVLLFLLAACGEAEQTPTVGTFNGREGGACVVNTKHWTHILNGMSVTITIVTEEFEANVELTLRVVSESLGEIVAGDDLFTVVDGQALTFEGTPIVLFSCGEWWVNPALVTPETPQGESA